MRVVVGSLFILLAGLTPGVKAYAVACSGASHIGCSEGIDQSGRSPGALYDAAVEGLKEARTPGERALARRAMRDALNPKMSNQRAVECNRNPGASRDYFACVAGAGPAPGLRMIISCQQNLSDGRILVDGQVLPAGTRYEVVRYQPSSTDNDWSHGSCDVEFTRK